MLSIRDSIINSEREEELVNFTQAESYHQFKQVNHCNCFDVTRNVDNNTGIWTTIRLEISCLLTHGFVMQFQRVLLQKCMRDRNRKVACSIHVELNASGGYSLKDALSFLSKRRQLNYIYQNLSFSSFELVIFILAMDKSNCTSSIVRQSYIILVFLGQFAHYTIRIQELMLFLAP